MKIQLKRKQAWAIITLTIFSLNSYGADPIVGLFVTKKDLGGARSALCVEALPDGRYDVSVFTAYCPSKGCMNTRFGDMWGQTKSVGNQIHIVEKENCELSITFKKNRARIKQNIESCSDMNGHPYLQANGTYQFIRSEVRNEDCSPVGPDICDPKDLSHKICP